MIPINKKANGCFGKSDLPVDVTNRLNFNDVISHTLNCVRLYRKIELI